MESLQTKDQHTTIPKLQPRTGCITNIAYKIRRKGEKEKGKKASWPSNTCRVSAQADRIQPDANARLKCGTQISVPIVQCLDVSLPSNARCFTQKIPKQRSTCILLYAARRVQKMYKTNHEDVEKGE